jgi:hypothetical protein
MLNVSRIQGGRPLRRFFALVLIVGVPACGGGSGAPSTPSTPVPTPTPAPAPTVNPFAAACGSPLPAFEDAYGFGVKVQTEPTPFKKVLNASPLVRNSAYCQAAGFGPFTFCNTRPESSAEREPCDHYFSGVSDTGRMGPNWFQDVNGRLLRCGGFGVPDEAPSCSLNSTNQYLLDVFGPGTYVACSGKGGPPSTNCGGCALDESVFGKIHGSPAGLCKQG